jgi:hypothetical protein
VHANCAAGIVRGRPGQTGVVDAVLDGAARAAQRARIVLLAADGVSNTEIAERTVVSRPTVIGWQARYEESGMAPPPPSTPRRPNGSPKIKSKRSTVCDDDRNVKPNNPPATPTSSRHLRTASAERRPRHNLN